MSNHSARDKQQLAFDVVIVMLATILVGAFVLNWFHDWTDGRRTLAALEAYVGALEIRAAKSQQFSASDARLSLLAGSSRVDAQSKLQAVVLLLAAETGVRLVSASPVTQPVPKGARITLNLKLIAQPETLTHFLVRLHGNWPLLVLDRCRIDAPQNDSNGFLKVSLRLHGFYMDKP